MAKKPARTLSSIVFPYKGKPHLRIEHLPREQGDQELTVARKFFGTLSLRQPEQFGDPQRSQEEPCDVLCRSSLGNRVGVQIVEVIDEDMRRLRQMRKDYSASISRDPAIMQAFAGCRLTIVDSGDPPYLPPIGTVAGRECLSELMAFLRVVGGEARTLQVGKLRSRSTTIGSERRRASGIVERFAPAHNKPTRFQWTGSGPVKRGVPPRDLISSTIAAKIEKRYSPPTFPFWLLVFSPDYAVEATHPELNACRDLLELRSHPFDRVWYFFPYPAQEIGHLVDIWPVQATT